MDPNRPPTNFETRVFDATSQIPEGKVTTYRDLGKFIGCNSAQAIGQALKRNPFAPTVPCHRVIKTDLTLGGFHGETMGPQMDRKKRLLMDEGIEFDSLDRVKIEYCMAL